MLIDYERDIKTNLEKNNTLLTKKFAELTDLQYEIELIERNSINVIQNIKDYIQQYADLHQMWCDFDQEKGRFELNSETGKKSKNCLKLIETNYLFGNDKPEVVKFKRISLYGYCWEVWLHYVRNGKEFIITLPIFKNVTKDNYKDVYYSIMTVDKFSYTTVFKTLFLSELKDGVSKFLKGDLND